MILASPPKTYSAADQAQMRDALRRADAQNFKQGRDVELGQGRLILTDQATGARYALNVMGGVVSCVSI